MARYDFRKDYKSPPMRPGVIARAFPAPVFYARILSEVLRAAWLARQNRYTDIEWIKSSERIVEHIEKVGIQIEVRNARVLAQLDGPCVIVGNHMSTMETFVLPSVIAPIRPVTFVVKRALIEAPIFKHVMRSRHPIVVGRKNPRDDLRTMLDDGCQRLRSGLSVVVFPQTTRTAAFNPHRFNSIGVKLARKAGVPVVPLALKTDAWGQGRWVKDIGNIDPYRAARFVFGEPIKPAGNGRDAHEAVVLFIRTQLESWGGMVLDEMVQNV